MLEIVRRDVEYRYRTGIIGNDYLFGFAPLTLGNSLIAKIAEGAYNDVGTYRQAIVELLVFVVCIGGVEPGCIYGSGIAYGYIASEYFEFFGCAAGEDDGMFFSAYALATASAISDVAPRIRTLAFMFIVESACLRYCNLALR